ncbi:MAG: phosphoglycerate kinase [bacterium]|nr:phosphoglycerate kinase [bacterium]
MINWVDDPNIELTGKRVFCRVDFNVPMDDEGNILDDTRIKAALPTIKFLMENNAKVILASHLGRPKGKPRRSLSLESIGTRLSELLNSDIIFVEDCVGDGVKRLINDLSDGGILLLENLRFHSGEEKNDEIFAKKLAQNIDIYVDDAFGAVHRAHASTEKITHFVKPVYGGLLIKAEIAALEKIVQSPAKPFVMVLGGAKVSDKISIISHMLPRINKLIIGGAMTYTFLQAQGRAIGKSKFEADRVAVAQNILNKAKQLGVEVLLPVDHMVVSTLEENEQARGCTDYIADRDIGVDIGPETAQSFTRALLDAGTIFWNGPMGIFERADCQAGTKALVKAICKASAFSVVGGGDSISALNQFGDVNDISHVSTGGGASMEFIEGAQLPGLKALGYVI